MSRKLIWVAAVALLLAFSTEARAKYRGFAREVFFGRYAGAAGAGAGRTGVTSSGDIVSTFHNPAGLADARGLGCCFSWTEAPRGAPDAVGYAFAGGNVRVGKYGVLGLSRYKFDYSPVAYPAGRGNHALAVAADASILVLTLAGEPVRDLLVGINIRSFQYDFETDRGRREDDGHAYWGDVGLIKYFLLGRTETGGHWLRLGGSLSNFTYSDIDLGGSAEDLPVALRLGTAYEMGWWGLTWNWGLRTVETVLRLEYQDVLNYEHRTAVKVGGELRLLEVLALRLGYYRETLEEYDSADAADHAEDTTYGLGLYLPFHKITQGKLPLRMGLDLVNMKPAEYLGGGSGDRVATVTFSANLLF